MNQSVLSIQKQLFSLQDIAYKEFHQKLIPTIGRDTIIGVRTPEIRKLAKKLAHTQQAEDFLCTLPHQYYDENILHALLIMSIQDIETCMTYTEKFLPYIDNWACCDIFSPKIFKKYPQQILEKSQIWIQSKHIYTVRFGIGMLLEHFLDERFQEEMLNWVIKIHSSEYYINMMRAWYFSTALIKQYESTLPYIQTLHLDKWTHNKTIQKAVESYRISADKKAYLKSLKIK